MKNIFGVAVLIIASPALAASPNQFDLICEGINTEGIIKETQKQFTERLRIDFATNRWCKSTCYYINEIKAVTADKIILDNKESRSNWNRESVDRREGIYIQDMAAAIAGLAFRRIGNCQVAKFSGFPACKF